MKTLIRSLVLLALVLSGTIAVQASDWDTVKRDGLFQYLFKVTPANHDNRCLIHLNYELDVPKAKVAKAFAALPAGCNAECPFREIPWKFFNNHLDHNLKNACRLYLEPMYSIASTGSGKSGISQANLGNVVQILQDGTGQIVASYQNGEGQGLFVVQLGNGNWAVVVQIGTNNLAKLWQINDNNGFKLTQMGDGNIYIGLQDGNDIRDVVQVDGQFYSDF